MKKIILLVLGLCLAPSLFASRGFNNTEFIDIGNDTSIEAHFSMTVGGWLAPYTNSNISTNSYTLIQRGRGGTNGWGFLINAIPGYGCSSSGGLLPLAFVKLGVAVICSTIYPPVHTTATAPTTTQMVFVAVVVTSTNVHFFMMDTTGTTTTQDVANNSAFAVGSPTEARIACALTNVGGNTDFYQGEIANLGVWDTVALSDAELTAFARNGPNAVRHPLSGYWALDGLQNPEPDLSGNNFSGTVTGGGVTGYFARGSYWPKR